MKMPHDNISDYKAEDKKIVMIEEFLQFDHTSNELPSMAPFTNNFLFYIFSLLGFEENCLTEEDWLILPQELWPTQTYYKVFKEYANQIVVTNYHCERAAGI